MTARDAVDTYIDNRLVAPSRIERWESRRASVVLEKLTSRVGTLGMAELLGGVDLAAVDTANSSAMRDMHVTLKQRRGHAALYGSLTRELAVSERVARLAVRASRGRSTHSAIRLADYRTGAKRSSRPLAARRWPPDSSWTTAVATR